MDLTKLEIYCLNNTCGDPVPNLDGKKTAYTKRKMNYAGASFTGAAMYRCPVNKENLKRIYSVQAIMRFSLQRMASKTDVSSTGSNTLRQTAAHCR